MKPRLFALALLAGSALLTPAAFAQFGPTGLPSPALIANADNFQPPKLTDYAAKLASQPDMTGLWTAMEPANAGVGPMFDPANAFYAPQPVRGEALFGPIPGTYDMGIPYTPEYKKMYENNVEEAKQGKSRDTFAACVPYGVPRMIGDSPVPMDIIQSPEVMFWYNDYGRTERRIFLDGRKHPTANQVTATGGGGPSYSGHSIGHWEGNTLVVDTVDMIAGHFDETSPPYSDKLHMVERLRLIDTNILEDQMTFTDPVTLEKPWVVTRYFRRGGGFGAGAGAGAAGFPGAPGGSPPPGAPPGAAPPGLPAGGPPAGAMPPGGAAGGGQRIDRSFINLNDRPCIPNVKIDEDGYQVVLLPAEVEAAAATKAKASAKTAKKKR